MSTKKTNPITQQIHKHYEELMTARQYCQKLMRFFVEYNCLSKAELCILILDKPKFKFFDEQLDAELTSTMRSASTGDISFEEASDKIRNIYIQIVEAISYVEKK